MHLAFETAGLEAIRRADGIQRNPATEGPAGWMLNDREIPVVDLAVWLGERSSLDFPRETPGRVLIFTDDDGPRGFLVDSCSRADEEQGGRLHPLPHALAPLTHLGIRGLWTTAGHSWLILDPQAVSSTLQRPLMPQPSAPQPPGTQPVASQPFASQPFASQPFASQPLASQPLASQPLASEPLASFLEPSPPGSPSPPPWQGRLLLFRTRHGETCEPPMRLALSITQVLEVTDLSTFDPVPGAPDLTPNFVRGLTLWRGQPLLAMDVDLRLGWPAKTPGAASSSNSEDRLVVVQPPQGPPVGLITTGASQLLRLPVAHRPAHLPLPTDLTLGVYELDQETIFVPDLERLTTAGAA